MEIIQERNMSMPYPTTVSFFTPLKLRRRGGHRMVVLPESSENANHNIELQPDIDEKLLKALVKATLWERQLRAGKVTLRDLIQQEGVSERYIQHILKLNFLSSGLKEAILEGRQSAGMTVDALRLSIPLLWQEQQQMFAS